MLGILFTIWLWGSYIAGVTCLLLVIAFKEFSIIAIPIGLAITILWPFIVLGWIVFAFGHLILWIGLSGGKAIKKYNKWRW